MKEYKGLRTLDELKKLIYEKRWSIDTERFDQGSDFVKIAFNHAGTEGIMLLSTFNGRFFGELKNGVSFSSDSAAHDNEPWFIALLEFAYVS